MIKVLRKLQGRSLTELRVRGVQAVACLSERAGLSAQTHVPGDAAFYAQFDASQWGGTPLSAERLLAHFRSRTSPAFFAAFTTPDETRAALGSRFGGRAKELLVARAEQLVAGRFDLLGLRALDFGDPIDWQLEPVAGKRSPLTHWSRIDYLNAATAGDKKITWELNRQQYFGVLGRAYWHTGDERYAETFARHLAAWMDANPPKLGINWASSLEVAFRAVSWLWSLYFFKDSPHLTPALFLRALKFLSLHARHLETYLSTYFSPNTHLTGEALGLFYLGTLLPELRAASRWRTTGETLLLAELERQVRPDGVYFEQTSYYHRYTTDFYTHFLMLRAANGAPPESLLESKLTALLDHLMYLTLPDGTTPLFGDDDGGRFTWLDERAANDFRATLATGAALSKRADYKFVAGEATEETLWLAGAEGLRVFDDLAPRTPAQTSRAFPDGGYYVMRDGWTRESNYLLLDCGPHGSLNGAHAHADALAILAAAARGRHALVDSGTYTYTGSPALREQFRSTAAHNTLTIDDQSSSVSESAFRWQQTAHAKCLGWMSHTRFDLFEGEHNGYQRLAAPAKHLRSVLFIKGDYWIMRDCVETSGAHRYELHFHFPAQSAPVYETQDGTTRMREVKSGGSGLDLLSFARGGAWRTDDTLISTCYGSSVVAPVCTFSFAGDAEEVITLLVPHAAGMTQLSGREVEAVGGRAFELTDGVTRDYLLIRARNAPTVETARLISDFSWTWARFHDNIELQELIAIDGHALHIDNVEAVRSPARVNYITARGAGAQLKVETDAGEGLFFAPLGARHVVFNDERNVVAQPDETQREKWVLNNK